MNLADNAFTYQEIAGKTNPLHDPRDTDVGCEPNSTVKRRSQPAGVERLAAQAEYRKHPPLQREVLPRHSRLAQCSRRVDVAHRHQKSPKCVPDRHRTNGPSMVTATFRPACALPYSRRVPSYMQL